MAAAGAPDRICRSVRHAQVANNRQLIYARSHGIVVNPNIGSDGTGRVDVRATLRTHDGALIHYEARGIIKIPADGIQRLAAGEVLPFAETYVRTTPKFETADERYAWLSEVVALGYNILSPNHIDYRIYRVL